MTLRDDCKFCFECKKIGLLRKAHRIVPRYGAVCDEHWREHDGLPQLTVEGQGLILRWKAAIKKSQGPEVQIQPQGETIVAKRIDEATKDAMRRDAAAGMNINQIAEKHHSSWPTVRDIVGNGHKPAKKNAPTKHGNSRVVMAGKLLDKWNTEANEAFAALPLEKKAELLATLE